MVFLERRKLMFTQNTEIVKNRDTKKGFERQNKTGNPKETEKMKKRNLSHVIF